MSGLDTPDIGGPGVSVRDDKSVWGLVDAVSILLVRERWWRVLLMVPDVSTIRKRLDEYTTWHSFHRPHEALGKLTPSEAAQGIKAADPVRYREGGELEPAIQIRRQHVGGDPRLLYPVIEVQPRHRPAA